MVLVVVEGHSPRLNMVPRTVTEEDLLDKVTARSRELGLLVFHSTAAVRDIGPGFPDLVIAGTRHIFAELKSAGGCLSPRQTMWRYRLVATGAEWHLWRPRDWAAGRINDLLEEITP